MAAYFHGNPPEISVGADSGLQTLVLMNPTTYVQFSDHHQHHHNQPETTSHNNNNNSLVFLNSSHAPPPSHPTAAQQFVGIPLSAHEATTATATAVDSISAATLHGFLPRVQYNLYGNHHHVDPTCETPRAAAQQGLSLTLSSQQQQHRPSQAHQQIGFGSGEDIRVGWGSTGSGVTNGLSGLLSSKYLKATQELLDEIVNVNTNNINGKTELLSSSTKKGSGGDKMIGESSAGAGGEGSVGGEAAGKRAAELSTAERQEIQMKKAKLISMLDEVEQRYRQYHHQMQIVITSFEQAAGVGSAKSYTSLALKTISRQFRCLKDAITGQIKAANKCLGEEDSSSGGRFEGSRLRFVDHQLRQQRALQQLGMIQHHSSNAWRPQRGLPERAVSVLRAWLFEHFLHPYPKDSDKHMLAKQTGLTRSQVSNWFINARVRLWKPMVEEMYTEEMKEQERNNVSVDDKPNQNNNEEAAPKSGSNNQEKSPVTEKNYQLNDNNQTNHSPELEGVASQVSPKRLRTNNNEVMIQPVNIDFNTNEKLTMKVLEDRQGLRDGYSFIGNFGHYQIDEIPRFDVSNQHLIAQRFSGNNGVSLTLGLPHCEGLSATHQSFMPSHNVQLGRRVELGEAGEFAAMNASASAPHSSSPAYNGIDIQNQKRFVAQLLPDFVA